MNYVEAMELVYGGWVVRRKSWAKNNWYILLAINKASCVELCTNNPDGTKVVITANWCAKAADKKAVDWVVA